MTTGSRGTWLCPDEEARGRVMENSPRVRRARTLASLAIGVSLLYIAPTYSYWVIPMFLVSWMITSTVDFRMRRSRVPEYHAAATVLLTQALLAGAVPLTGGARSPMLPLIIVPTGFVATRFRPRVCFVATAIAITMLIVVTVAVDPDQAFGHPAGLIVAVALLLGVDAATQALFAAELQHRTRAVLDPLTGLLNRQGLERRFDELAEQARVTGAPISLLVCDLDHFKRINDTYGHATGDAVLREIAHALRTQLRSFELIYRLGGEEFLVVLPGAALDDAVELGEQLREAAHACRPEGLEITISVGAAADWGESLRFETVFEAADRALYEAKAAGRDQVVGAGSPARRGAPQPALEVTSGE